MRKFFTTISEKELSLLKLARFEKNEAVYQRNNLILDFLFYTGLRVSELVNLKHRDYQEQSLRIHGKGNKIRQALVPPFLEKYLRLGAKGYLFTNQNGHRLLTDKVREIIRTRTKLAGLKKWVSPHTFRRSFATLLDRRKVRMTTIQKLLGHSNLETTAQYIHNDFETLYADYNPLKRKEYQKELMRKRRNNGLTDKNVSLVSPKLDPNLNFSPSVSPQILALNNSVSPENKVLAPELVSPVRPNQKKLDPVSPCSNYQELKKEVEQLRTEKNKDFEKFFTENENQKATHKQKIIEFYQEITTYKETIRELQEQNKSLIEKYSRLENQSKNQTNSLSIPNLSALINKHQKIQTIQ
ncbi:11035_t:CDS:2 [Ambispora gerdemannii]|uniref:11035_t:CDS:1 n=1 Tax=Ambispora gerdemannii TaxID=144530 RepID=A0A9N9H3R5_9GLOM|nr:11035_t:CDS:2 [Ambispora gerdemannii]